MHAGDGPAPSPTSNANAQFEKYKSLTASVLSSRPPPPPSAAVAPAVVVGRRPSEMLFNSKQQRESQANLLVCLPLGMGVILGVGIYSQYERPPYPPAEQEAHKARSSALWLAFLVAWLVMLGMWAYVRQRMHALVRLNDMVRFERVLIGYLFCCGLLVNGAEMASQYLGLGDAAMTFLVFYTFSFGNLGLRRSLLVSAATLAVYIATALPWVGALTGHRYDAAWRITSTLPIVLYTLFITVPCYFVEELQRRKVSLELELTQVSYEMQEQCELSQQLLLNVLPHEIIPAFILSDDSDEVFAETFSKCSILFMKVVGLDLTHAMSTTESVTVLNELICRFDALTDAYGVEKIKTIGNTYMVASGLPTPNEMHHCHNIAAFALGMTATLQTFADEMDFDLTYKIGISSGAAVAGVIGTKAKFSYDLWGDTVNTASRMCSHCPEGQIQVTEQTHALLHGDFVLEDRGIIAVKGKGSMHTYMLLGEQGDNTWRSRAQKLTKPTVSISQTLRQKRTLIAAAERRRQAALPRQTRWHGGGCTPSTAKPEHVFSKPYAAALNFWWETNSEAREMEKDFQRERKREVQSFVQIFWLLTLVALVLYLEMMEMFYFCVDDEACASRVCTRTDRRYTSVWGMQLGRIIKAGFFFPGIILFVLFTTNERVRFEHGLTKITFFFLLAIGLGLAVIVAFTSRVHSSVFLLLVFIINNFTLLQHGNLLLLNALLLFVFEILVISSEHVDRWPQENWYVSFSLEKLLPVTMVALACNYATERRYRAVFLKMRALRQQQDDYDTEKHVTEELLKHALPDPVLATLKEGRHPAVGSYGTLMFADICDFTSFSGSVTALKLVEILNHMFILFDTLVAQHQVEKLKTLGDCYVVSSGVLASSPDHAEAMCATAAGMQQALDLVNQRFTLTLQIRVGMHSGPVVGGVIGSKKFTFDLWGRTVEYANLMESEGVPGRINLSEDTYLQAKKSPLLHFEDRGDVRVDGERGAARMYLLSEANQCDPRFGLMFEQEASSYAHDAVAEEGGIGEEGGDGRFQPGARFTV